MTQAEATFSISTHFHIINPYNSKFIDFSTAPNNEEAIKILTFSDMHHGVICAEMEGEVYDYISREPSRYMEYDEDGFSHTFRGAFRYFLRIAGMVCN